VSATCFDPLSVGGLTAAGTVARWITTLQTPEAQAAFYAKVGGLLAAFMGIEREAFDMLEAEAR